MNNRIVELDIIKGICIIGIVFNHAGHGLLWLSYFYLYGFYFVGGFTYHDKSFMKLLFSKITRIYIPFIISNLFAEAVCIFLHRVTNYGGGVTQWTQYLLSILKFNLKESIMAPSWFLFPLFCISIIFFWLKKIIRRNEILCLISFCAFIAAIHYRTILSAIQWNNCAIIINLAVALFAYTCGYTYKQNDKIRNFAEKSKYSFDFFIIACLVLCEAKYYWNYHLDLRAGFVSSGKWMFVTYISGIYFLIYFSKVIGNHNCWLKRLLSYIGKRSMSIMFFHVLCFSIVTLIGIYILKDSYEPSWTNAFHGKLYGYANACIGIVVPLIVGYWMENLIKGIQKLKSARQINYI